MESPLASENRSNVNRSNSFSIMMVILLIINATFSVFIFAYSNNAVGKLNQSIERLNTLENGLQNQITALGTYNSSQYQVVGTNVSLSGLYDNVAGSVVTIVGLIVQQGFFRQQVVQVEGSGFIYDFLGRMVIITNFHVVDGANNVTVTFRDGYSYGAAVLGSDAYYDLAVLTVNAPASEFRSLRVASSSILKVGDPVIAVGNPFGLSGSMTTGIVSQLGRSITESTTSSFPIADVIQTNAAINPGNSGGPLINYQGQVVGLTTAIAANSQGVGFAIPSNAILREVPSLVTIGSYSQHPWLGIAETDMTYYIATRMNVNVTYGVLITQVTSGGPAAVAGLRAGTQQAVVAGLTTTIGGDVIIAFNGTRIVNEDSLSTYLEENTVPNQRITITIVRNGVTMDISAVVGTRPPPS